MTLAHHEAVELARVAAVVAATGLTLRAVPGLVRSSARRSRRR